jgi:hypothetical protein
VRRRARQDGVRFRHLGVVRRSARLSNTASSGSMPPHGVGVVGQLNSMRRPAAPGSTSRHTLHPRDRSAIVDLPPITHCHGGPWSMEAEQRRVHAAPRYDVVNYQVPELRALRQQPATRR